MARIPQQKIDEILQAADLVSYVSRYVALKRTGKNLKGLCPFHKEKTPSFTVSPEKQFYHCFGCNKGGNLFSFLMEIEKISYLDAIKRVAADLGIQLPRTEHVTDPAVKTEIEKLLLLNEQVKDFYKNELQKKSAAKASLYLKHRKISDETVRRFEIGYAPNNWDSLQRKSFPPKELETLGLIQQKESSSGFYDKFRNRLMFPFHNLTGKVIGFGGRALTDDQQPKYLNSPESSVYQKGSVFYGLYQSAESIRKQQSAIIVEGYFDLLRLIDSGILNVVASSGTALSINQAQLLKRYTKNVTLAYDSDEAGIRAALRNALILESADLNVTILSIPEPHDPDSYILTNGKKAFLNLFSGRIAPIEFRLLNFRKDPEHQSMEARQIFTDQILEDLTQLPNDTKVGLYIHRISEVLEISESMIISRFNRMKQQFRGRTIESDRERTKPEKPQISLRKGQWRAEETLIALLLENNIEVNKQILDQISTSDFVNSDYRDIFNQIATMWEESGEINQSDLTEENASFSGMLPKLKMVEINHPEKLAADCIYQIRKWSLDSRFNEIKRLIHEESSSEKSVMHYMKELSAIRKKLSEIEREHSKYLKTNL